ncbi:MULTISPECIES: flagellar biosynthesis protein FliQ [Halanaerobium]|jgi:flagellar biosynthetic protein FliQ|uniref:Flagellar biosynthetic protein FliQ n=1 Tax=Halanaerobium kushneri TaxID=56779 RepID=A0A1N6UBH3_9FIRM|nr:MULTISPECIES: flagellar biosynthesis protein FliQ [Halanaerobium]PUU89690.1 MAG: flagellar biosynthetic protein FliQ [Halanaerobium sp.]PUU94686.1 MAG: flagellar biosynthetic protein FliQ [Halanaerobium sp.]RCW60255.1 flagellar biosynthetic protein FliQ [Halanaerobium sp. ST460_2HS_T2]SIQ62910.1 flagellar biosynthetic protein FliQ [Halanaerobium kushneri]
MGEAVVLDIGRQALYTVIIVVLPVLGAGLITGLLVAIFQATTQIQEQTLAFVPKIFAVLASIAFFGPWIMTTVVEFVQELLQNIPTYIS